MVRNRRFASLFFSAALIFAISTISTSAVFAEDVSDSGVLPDQDLRLYAQSDENDANDPLETVNRAVFGFNDVFQDSFLGPIARFYNETIPVNGRLAVSNTFKNAAAPITFVNDVLQLEVDRALITLTRFFLNTTAGMGGMADFAAEIGLKPHREDFGQTLGVYGIGEGFYLVLPILGPSNPRDALGKLFVDSFFNPLGLYLDNIDKEAIRYGLAATGGFLEFADFIDEFERLRVTSVDYYAAVRSLYRQQRASEIANGDDIGLPPIPDFSPGLNEYPDPAGGEPLASAEGGRIVK